jgi:hypothetical protein
MTKTYRNKWLEIVWRRSEPEFIIIKYLNSHLVYWQNCSGISIATGIEVGHVYKVLAEWYASGICEWNYVDGFRLSVMGQSHYRRYVAEHYL